MNYENLNYCTYLCKYHIVFIQKYRKKILYSHIKRYLIERFKELSSRKECKIEAGIGGIMVDHVHMVISIPPKYSVSSIIGFLKGKTAIAIAQDFGGRKRNFTGEHFWARGYFVSTVGLDEETIKKYVENQERQDCREEALNKR